jgi:hypothetical protein
MPVPVSGITWSDDQTTTARSVRSADQALALGHAKRRRLEAKRSIPC